MAKKLSGDLILPALDGTNYNDLVTQISDAYAQGRQKAVQAVNANMLETYWQIGRYIVEFEQGGNIRAQYGASLLEKLSKDLFLAHGKGFSLSNLKRMRQFYFQYSIGATVSHQLSWSHYVELLKIENELERSFYEKQLQPDNNDSNDI